MSASDLSLYPMPEWSSPQRVEGALEDMRHCSDEQSSNRAYGRFLHAVGNDHAGIYYPVAVPAVRMLDDILKLDNTWARSAALNVLLDLCGSFAPIADKMLLPDGTTADTATALLEAARSLRPTIASMLNDPAREATEKAWAAELLECLEQGR